MSTLEQLLRLTIVITVMAEKSSSLKRSSPLSNHSIKQPGAKYSVSSVCGEMPHSTTAPHTSVDLKVNMADREFSDIMVESGEEIHRSRPQNVPYKRVVHSAQQSMLAFMAVTFIYVLAAIIICCPILSIICFILPIGMAIKYSLDACRFCRATRTCVCYKEDRLSHADVMLLHETEENKAIFQTMLVLEGGLQINRLSDIINSRLICAQNENGNLYYPRFTQKVVPLCCGYVWTEDSDFNISNHIYLMPTTIKDSKDLQEYISQMSSMQLSFDRPLWEIQVLESFGEKKQMILLLRTHPSLSDGISLVKIFHRAVTDGQSTLELKAHFGSLSVIFDVLRSFVIGPLCFLTCLFTRKDRNGLLKSKLSGKKIAVWTEPFSLLAASRVQQITRTKLGDIFLSVTAGSIRYYLQSLGEDLPSDLKATIPVDLRENDNVNMYMGNIYANVPVKLPVSTEGAIPRLWDVSQIMERMRDSALPVILYVVWWNFLHILPQKLCSILQDAIVGKSSCIVSNLPGPQHKVKIATKEVTSIVYWTPTKSNVGLSVSFLTYGDGIRIGILADEAVVPEPKLLAKYLSQQMSILESLVANRRVPGEHSNPSFVFGASVLKNTQQPTVDELQSRINAIQSELASLKTLYETVEDSEYSDNREKLANRVVTLKKEFEELLSQTQAKRESNSSASDGTQKAKKGSKGHSGTFSGTIPQISLPSSQRPLSTYSTQNLNGSTSTDNEQKQCLANFICVNTSSPLNKRASSNSMADVVMNIEHQYLTLDNVEHVEMEDNFSPRVERKGNNKYYTELKVSTL